MARAWITDRWLSQDAPAAARRAVAGSKHPERLALDKVPARYRLTRYGIGDRWAVQWFDTDAAGHRRRRTRSFPTLGQAERHVTAISDDQYSGRYVNTDDQRRTFGETAKAWRRSQTDIRDSSARLYGDILRIHVLPRWETTPLGRITEDEINEWVRQLKAGTAPRAARNNAAAKPPAPRYLHQIVNVVFGGVMRYAQRRRWIATNPVEHVRVPRDVPDPDREERRKVFLTYDQVERLADMATVAGGERDGLMVLLMAYVGLRPGEMFALRVGDVDLKARRVNVARTLTRDADGWHVGATKTGESRRVALPPDLVLPFTLWTRGRDPGAYMFPARGGGFIRPENWRNRVFDKAKAYAGLEGVAGLRPHSLRHTFASLAIAAGCDVRTLAAALGHADVSMTLNEYAGLWPDRLDEVATAMAARRATAVSVAECNPDGGDA